MSVSEKVASLAKESSWLWISTPLRGACFLAALVSLLAGALLLERIPAWSILDYALVNPQTDNWESVSANLVQSIHSKAPIVLLVGGSATRELTGSDSYISQYISQTCGSPILFVNAGTSDQNLSDSLILESAVPRQQQALVIVGMNYYRLGEALSRVSSDTYWPNFPFSQPRAAWEALGEKENAQRGDRPLNQLGWLLLHSVGYGWATEKRGYAALTSQADVHPYNDVHNAAPRPPLPGGEKREIVSQYIALRWPAYLEQHRASTNLWEQFAKYERSRGIKVIFLALPESPSMAPADALFGPIFEQSMEQLRGAGFTVVDWRRTSTLREIDFYDQQHLLESGRRRIASQFLHFVARSLPACKRPPQ